MKHSPLQAQPVKRPLTEKVNGSDNVVMSGGQKSGSSSAASTLNRKPSAAELQSVTAHTIKPQLATEPPRPSAGDDVSPAKKPPVSMDKDV